MKRSLDGGLNVAGTPRPDGSLVLELDFHGVTVISQLSRTAVRQLAHALGQAATETASSRAVTETTCVSS